MGEPSAVGRAAQRAAIPAGAVGGGRQPALGVLAVAAVAMAVVVLLALRRHDEPLDAGDA